MEIKKMNKKGGVLVLIVIMGFILAMLFMWKIGVFKEFWEFIKCLGKNKLECLS